MEQSVAGQPLKAHLLAVLRREMVGVGLPEDGKMIFSCPLAQLLAPASGSVLLRQGAKEALRKLRVNTAMDPCLFWNVRKAS